MKLITENDEDLPRCPSYLHVVVRQRADSVCTRFSHGSLLVNLMLHATFACKYCCWGQGFLVLQCGCKIPGSSNNGVSDGPRQPFSYSCLLAVSTSSLTPLKDNQPFLMLLYLLLLFTSFHPGIWTVL